MAKMTSLEEMTAYATLYHEAMPTVPHYRKAYRQWRAAYVLAGYPDELGRKILKFFEQVYPKGK